MNSVNVIGRGRVGSALAARLLDRGVDVREDDAELVVICVPDRAIPDVASSIDPGPWVAHVSGATPLAALEPHSKRLTVHPLQTFTLDRGPEQLEGAWAAVSGESAGALAAGDGLAGFLGLKPFELADEMRPLYHAAASFVSAFLVTLHDVSAELMEAAGAPPEALEPLMRRTIENGFQHTGPLVRDDWETVERHAEAIAEQSPEVLPLYRALAETEAALLGTRTP
jgi:predicted short-subunit dehydrogenase-like oxidoreductase (DUF2520 family)